MNNVVYSVFVKPKFDTPKEKNNLLSFEEYNTELIECKQGYAKKCGAEWIFFDDLKKISQFQKKFSINTIYDAINLYKVKYPIYRILGFDLRSSILKCLVSSKLFAPG